MLVDLSLGLEAVGRWVRGVDSRDCKKRKSESIWCFYRDLLTLPGWFEVLLGDEADSAESGGFLQELTNFCGVDDLDRESESLLCFAGSDHCLEGAVGKKNELHSEGILFFEVSVGESLSSHEPLLGGGRGIFRRKKETPSNDLSTWWSRTYEEGYLFLRGNYPGSVV